MSFNLNRTLGPLQEMWRTMGFEHIEKLNNCP